MIWRASVPTSRRGAAMEGECPHEPPSAHSAEGKRCRDPRVARLLSPHSKLCASSSVGGVTAAGQADACPSQGSASNETRNRKPETSQWRRVVACWLVVALSTLTACIRQDPLPADSGMRLVSTAPHLTECVCAIGAGHLLVGRTATCDYPPEVVSEIPITGDFAVPWLEPLLAVRPTHVLETVLSDPALRDRLTALNIPVVHVPCTRLDQIPDALRQLGVLCDRSTRANQLADDIQSGIERARQAASSYQARPRVLLLFAPDVSITAGPNAFVTTLLELAGGVSVGHDLEADYPRVSLEWIIAQDPDLLLCIFETTLPPLEVYARQTGWRSLRAVRSGRVYTVTDLNTVSRPGPRVLDGIAQIKVVLDQDAERFAKQSPTPDRP